MTASIKKSESKEFFHYQGAGYLTLMRLFSEIYKETAGFDFLDIGCGKGRAVFVAEYFGYDEITGIDLDEELISDARNNLKTYPFKRTESTIQLIKANAIEYEYHNKPTVYFLFNPFSEEVMQKVVNRIVTLTRSETWFVYMNPLYLKPFEERGLENYKEFKTGLYMEAIIFRLKARS